MATKAAEARKLRRRLRADVLDDDVWDDDVTDDVTGTLAILR
jgi:hypothetical protein